MNKSLASPQITIKLSPNVEGGNLAEIYQSKATKMALLRRDGESDFTRITPLVLCRDFLTDVYSYSHADKKFGIYGCAFDPSLEKPQKDGCFLQMIFPDNKSQADFEKNIIHLHTIEGANNYSFTEYLPTENPRECVLIGDAHWIRSCLLFSLYSSLLRVFSYDLPEDGWIPAMRKMDDGDNTDARLVNSVTDEIWERVASELRLLELPDFCGLDPKKHNTSEVHHNSGFYSVFGTHREIHEPTVMENTHWKHFKEAGWQLHTK